MRAIRSGEWMAESMVPFFLATNGRKLDRTYFRNFRIELTYLPVTSRDSKWVPPECKSDKSERKLA
jgi:hypothetical protein